MAIFTPNATCALRIVGEAYPLHAGDRFVLTFDKHILVNGIREFARARGAQTTDAPTVATTTRRREAAAALHLCALDIARRLVIRLLIRIRHGLFFTERITAR